MTNFCKGLRDLKIHGKKPHVAHARNLHHEGSILGFARPSYQQDLSTNELGNFSNVIPRLDLLRESRQDFKTQRRPWSTVENLRGVVTIGPGQFAPIASKLTHMFLRICFRYLHKELIDRKIAPRRSDHQIARFERGCCIQPLQQFVRIALNLRLCGFPSAGKSPASPTSLLLGPYSTGSTTITVFRTHSQDDPGVVCFKPLHEVVSGLSPRVFRANRQLAIVEVPCSKTGTATGDRCFSKVSRLLAFGADEIMTKRLDLLGGQKRELHGYVFLTRNCVEREIHTPPVAQSFCSAFTILKRLPLPMQSDNTYPPHTPTVAPEPMPPLGGTGA